MTSPGGTGLAGDMDDFLVAADQQVYYRPADVGARYWGRCRNSCLSENCYQDDCSTPKTHNQNNK